MADLNFQDVVDLSVDTLLLGVASLQFGHSTVSTAGLVFSNTAGQLVLQASPTGNITFGFPTSDGTLLTNVNVSAGTTSNNLSALVFSNSNGVSFGLNGSTVTGSVEAGATATGNFGAAAAGTQTATSGTVVWSNSNGVSFGMSGSSQVTASVDAIKSISGGTTRLTNGEAVFSNSNGVSFGVNGNTVTASIATSLTNVNVSAGTTSNNLSALVFSNSNGVSFGLNGSTVTGSVAAGATATGNFGAAAAGTQTATSGTVVWSNSNGVSFGMSGSSQVTASVDAIKSISGGTTRLTNGEAVFSNSNGVSFGVNGNTVTASIATSLTNVNVSAGTTSNNLSALVFSNSNGVSFGLNGSTVTGSVAAGATATGNFGAAAAGTQTATSGTVVWSNSNGVSFGMSGSSQVTASVDAIKSISGGTTRLTNGEAVFSNSNGVSFGVNGNTVTASIATSLTNINVSAGTTSNNLSAVTFSNSNGISFGINGSVITGSIATSLSVVNFSAGTTSGNLGSVVFSNSNNVSFGLNGATVTASIGATTDFFDNIGLGGTLASWAFTNSHRSLLVAPLVPGNGPLRNGFTANTLLWPMSISGSSATLSNAWSSWIYIGIYTLNAGTLSLQNSLSISFGYAGAATNNSTGVVGNRWLSAHSSVWSSQPVFASDSVYYIGWFWSSAGALGQTGNAYGMFPAVSSIYSGTINASVSNNATTMGHYPWFGVYTATTNAFPLLISSNSLNKSVANVLGSPRIIFAANAAMTAF